MAPLAQKMKNPHESLLFTSGKSVQCEGKHTQRRKIQQTHTHFAIQCVAMVMRSARPNLKKAQSDSEAAGSRKQKTVGQRGWKKDVEEKLLLESDDIPAWSGNQTFTQLEKSRVTFARLLQDCRCVCVCSGRAAVTTKNKVFKLSRSDR